MFHITPLSFSILAKEYLKVKRMYTIIKGNNRKGEINMHKIEIAAVKLRNSLNRAFPGDPKKLFSSGIITAGGSGARMGGVAKQLMELCGIPCILYSLRAFQLCPDICEIIVVA